MPVRVRKLAQDLERTPAQVLGLLHALGFPRYKSSEDQLADPVAAKVRAAVRVGLTADPVTPEAERRARDASQEAAGPVGMAALVPGVVPLGAKAPPPRAPVTPRKPAPGPGARDPRAAAPSGSPGLDRPDSLGGSARTPQEATVGGSDPGRAERDALRAERDALRAERDALRAERAARLAERDALVAERDAARAERDAAFAAADVAARTDRERLMAPPSGVSALLEARGLRGRDEQARALAGLLRERWIEADALGVVDPAAVKAALTERVVLVDGDPPEPMAGAVGVSVSPDRAEVPGARELVRRLERVAELLLLHGWRRVRAVGVPVRWHGLLRLRFDPRIELSIVPGGPRDRERAARDVDGVDVVWLWGVSGDDGAREAWARAKLVLDGPDAVGPATAAARQALERL